MSETQPVGAEEEEKLKDADAPESADQDTLDENERTKMMINEEARKRFATM